VQHARTRLRALVVAALAVAITSTTATAAHAAPSTSDLTKQITAMSDKLENITESYNAMNESLAKTVADEKTLQASLKPAQAALVVAGKQVQALAATAYITGRVGPVNVFLGGPDGLLDKMSYLDQLSRDQQRDIDTYTATTRDYGSRQAALKAAQAKQAAQLKVIGATKKDIVSKLKTLRAKRVAAYGRASEPATAHNLRVPAVSGKAGKAVAYAVAAFNRHPTPTYLFATAGPNHYDCSGLTMASWRAAGVSLSHNARTQYYSLPHPKSPSAGDLVFYRGLEHVAIYIGGGRIIAATTDGEPLKNEPVNVSPIYGYGRPS
jgi:cell wall-associated NlpC family hydrolase